MSAEGEETWSVLRILQWTAGYLERSGSASGRLDAEVLLAHVLGCERVALYVDYARPLSPGERDQYRALVKRRSGGEPVAYIVGEREFWSIPFHVEPGVLIPRPETELLVEVALSAARKRSGEPLRIADVGTGTGCVAVALATELPDSSVYAGDVAPVPLRLARQNAERAGVGARVSVVEGDGLRGLWQHTGGHPFDLVVSNPPYLRDGERSTLMRDVRDHEPPEALFAGEDGLSIIEPLLRDCGDPQVVRPGAVIALEVGGTEQAAVVAGFMRQGGLQDVVIHNDYADLGRVVVGVSSNG